jgi:hypothetical protein
VHVSFYFENFLTFFPPKRLPVPERLHLIECRGLRPAMQRFETWLWRNRRQFFAERKSRSAADPDAACITPPPEGGINETDTITLNNST